MRSYINFLILKTIAMKYPPVSKSIYGKIFLFLLVASFVANRLIYGAYDSKSSLWNDINCITGLIGLIIMGTIGLKQGYKIYSLYCFIGASVCLILWILFL